MRLIALSKHLTVMLAMAVPLMTVAAPTKALTISASPITQGTNATTKHNDGRIVLAQNGKNSCRRLGNRKSRNSNTPVTVTFVNRSGEYRSAFWIDFKGRMVHYKDIQPGGKFTINTFVTHPWMFVDGPGNCIEMFMPRRGVSQHNLKVRSRGFGPE